jgi:hypothetical protein
VGLIGGLCGGDPIRSPDDFADLARVSLLKRHDVHMKRAPVRSGALRILGFAFGFCLFLRRFRLGKVQV